MKNDDDDYCGVASFNFNAFLGRLARACKPHDWRDEERLEGTGDLSHAENDRIFASTTDKLTDPKYYDTENAGVFLRRLDRLKRAGALFAIRAYRIFGRLFLQRGP
jgi:hypothetical protein